jgi:hypothetical protein
LIYLLIFGLDKDDDGFFGAHRLKNGLQSRKGCA